MYFFRAMVAVILLLLALPLRAEMEECGVECEAFEGHLSRGKLTEAIIALPDASVSYKGESLLNFVFREKRIRFSDYDAVLDKFIRDGADFASVGSDGNPPIYHAMQRFLSSTPAHFEKMIDAGADPNARFIDPTSQTYAPLIHFATSRPHLLNLFLSRGADPNSTDANGNTALHVAAAKNDYASTLILLRKNADFFARNKFGLQAADVSLPLFGEVHKALMEIEMADFNLLNPGSEFFVSVGFFTGDKVTNVVRTADKECQKMTDQAYHMSKMGESRYSLVPMYKCGKTAISFGVSLDSFWVTYIRQHWGAYSHEGWKVLIEEMGKKSKVTADFSQNDLDQFRNGSLDLLVTKFENGTEVKILRNAQQLEFGVSMVVDYPSKKIRNHVP